MTTYSIDFSSTKQQNKKFEALVHYIVEAVNPSV